MKNVLIPVLRVIKPTEEEVRCEERFARLVISHVQAHVPKGCRTVLTGSVAKRTFLRDKRDVDIFVLFDRTVPRDALEPSLKAIMASAFPAIGYQLSYAEHPYARFHFEGRRIDLVPAYKIADASERISAVDRSVLHTRFVLKNMDPGQTGDVLLLKQFLKANGLYGAEIKIAGFSGYLCELLVLYYGSFANLMKAAARWKTPMSMGFSNHANVTNNGSAKSNHATKPKKQTPRQKSSGIADTCKRFESSFVVVDPTDDNRNVAAAVSEANLKLFISLCRSFLAKPTTQFFFRKPATFEEKAARAGRGRVVFLLSMPRPEIVDDVLWGQIHKLAGQLERHLKDFEFAPRHILADDSRHIVRFAIVLDADRLPPTMLVEGPPLEMKKHVEQFRKSHGKAKFSIKKKRIYATVKRPVVKAEGAIMRFFQYFSTTKSHLAYPEEMLVLGRLPSGKGNQ